MATEAEGKERLMTKAVIKMNFLIFKTMTIIVAVVSIQQ